MIKWHSLFMFSIIAINLTACGQKNDSYLTEQTNTFKIQANQNLSDFTNSMLLDSKTPSGLGTLLALDNSIFATKVEACTTFLIDKNTLLTNSHCIPQALKDNSNTDCGGLLQMAIKTESDVVRTKCQKVIFFSQISENVKNDNDYAVIKIADDVLIPRYFNLDRNGFNENDRASFLTLNHSMVNGVIRSQFIEHHCLIKSSDNFASINSPASSPLVGFKEQNSDDRCKVVHGNSGSPVITNNYNFAGIVHAGYFPKENDLNSSNSILKNITPNLGILTNFRCLKFNFESLDRDLPLSCSQENSSNLSTNEKKIEVRLNEKIQLFVNKVLENNSKVVQYNMKTDSTGKSKLLITFAPKCIQPIETWDQIEQSKIQRSFLGNKSFQFQTNSYLLSFSPNLDYYGNIDLSIDSSIIGTYIMEISNLQKLNSTREAMLKMTLSTGTIVDSIIPLCQ